MIFDKKDFQAIRQDVPFYLRRRELQGRQRDFIIGLLRDGGQAKQPYERRQSQNVKL